MRSHLACFPVYKEGVNVPKNVAKVIFDASVTEIHANAFSHCKQLKDVELNDGVMRIGRDAFRDCTSLTIINLPSSVTEVGVDAFTQCTNLREVILNEGLQKIGHFAFWDCPSLTVIRLPSTVTEIGEGAFGNCTNLREVVLNEGLQKIEYDTFAECESLTVIKLPSSVTEVATYAFRSCTNLTDVSLNGRPRKIGRSAFEGCRSLEYVKFPTISKRVQTLIEAGQTQIEDKLTGYRHFGWRRGELLVSPEAIRDGNWVATKTNLNQLLLWISHYELKEATTLFELAMWKAKIEETGALTAEERNACCGEAPGPVRDTIMQYF